MYEFFFFISLSYCFDKKINKENILYILYSYKYYIYVCICLKYKDGYFIFVYIFE